MKQLWRKIKREYFDIPVNIRNGIIVLLFLLLISVSMPFFYKKYFQKPVPSITPEEIATLDSIIKLMQNSESNIVSIAHECFDPNKAEAEKWVEYGIPLWLGERISNYIKKGGKFNKSEDLLKIYGFTQANLDKVSSYLVFSPEPESKKQVENKPFKTYFKKEVKITRIQLLEINTADSTKLEGLSGIGPVLASRIVKYRKLLGGFYKKDQLKEVFGMNDETFKKIETKIEIDTAEIEKIDLQTVAIGTLIKHPYIGKKRAQLIIKLRQIENLTDINSLSKNNIFTPEALSLLEPYLK